MLGAHSHEQFVFLVAQDEPMAAHVHDHYGLSVATKDDFDEVVRRAMAWKERLPEEVTVDGWMAKDGSKRLSGKSLTLSGGRQLFAAGAFFDRASQGGGRTHGATATTGTTSTGAKPTGTKSPGTKSTTEPKR